VAQHFQILILQWFEAFLIMCVFVHCLITTNVCIKTLPRKTLLFIL